MTVLLFAKMRTLIRLKAGHPGSNCPIRETEGFDPPRLLGESAYHTNRRGDIISHPSAYGRRGWSSLVYHPSTKRIEVGKGWILAVSLGMSPDTPPEIMQDYVAEQEAIAEPAPQG